MLNSMGKFRNTCLLIEKSLPYTYIPLGTVYIIESECSNYDEVEKKENFGFWKKKILSETRHGLKTIQS